MNWSRQTPDKPLFEDVLWSRPENRRHAGKLLIIGGHSQSFNAVSQTYAAATKAGAGTIRVILPERLRKMVSSFFPEAEFAPSNQIGSFGREALAELLDATDWADGVMLAGDLGRNSETALLLDDFVEKYAGLLALAGDSIDYFLNHSDKLTKRQKTLVIGGLNQIQKLASPNLIQQKADFIKVLEQVSNWVEKTDLSVVTVHSKQAIIAYKQKISTTPVEVAEPDESLAAYATVWYLQQPEKPFEALTTAIHVMSDRSS